MREACGVCRVDGMSNESVYEPRRYELFGMCYMGEVKKCVVVDEGKQQISK